MLRRFDLETVALESIVCVVTTVDCIAKSTGVKGFGGMKAKTAFVSQDTRIEAACGYR